MPFETALSRGDIIRVNLDPDQGSEQGGERTALVISPEIINRNSPVILVAAITSKKVDRIYPFELLLTSENGLARPSKVMLIHIRGVDRQRISDRYGRLSQAQFAALDMAIRIATGLERL